MAVEVTFYNADGGSYTTSDPLEITRLRASRGHYRSAKQAAAPAQDGQFHPSDHKAEEVIAYLGEHPEERDRVVAEEKAGKGRTSIIGD